MSARLLARPVAAPRLYAIYPGWQHPSLLRGVRTSDPPTGHGSRAAARHQYLTDAYSYGGGVVTLANGTTLMVLEDHLTGRELWRSDGTATGTTLTRDLTPGLLSSSQGPTSLTAAGNTAYFFSATSFGGTLGLWKTDGTTPGTIVLHEFDGVLDDHDSWQGEIAALGSSAFFSFDGGLWKTDGTVAGTQELKRFPPAELYDFERPGLEVAQALGDVMLLVANDAASGMELWKTDGTEAGTVLVKELVSGPASSYPHQFTKLGTSVFFTAHDATHGFEPFVTNGTPEGTVRLADIWPGAESGMRILDEDQTAFITPLAIEDRGIVLFTAAEPEGGAELWRTDGTAAGTYRWVDTAPGAISADPSNLARVGDRLFFFAVDEAHGREPWAVSLDHTGTGSFIQSSRHRAVPVGR